MGREDAAKRGEDEAVSIAVRDLDTDAESDTSTGAWIGRKIIVIKLSERRHQNLDRDKIADVFKETVA